MTTPTEHDFTPDADPAVHLTAYALGELDPASPEYAAVEDRLSSEAQARAEVESIRALTADLSTALAEEPLPAIESKPPVSSAATVPAPLPIPIRSWPRRLAVAAGLAAAAALGVALILPNVIERREAALAQQRLAQANDLYHQGLLSHEGWIAAADAADDPRAFDLALGKTQGLTDDHWLAAIESEAQARSWQHSSSLRGLYLREPSGSEGDDPVTLVYDIRDLVPATPHFTDGPEFGLAESLSNTNSGGGGGGGNSVFADADGDKAYGNSYFDPAVGGDRPPNSPPSGPQHRTNTRLGTSVDTFQITRSTVNAVYNEAMADAQGKLASGNYAGASNDLARARAVLERNQAILSVIEHEAQRNQAINLAIDVTQQQAAAAVSANMTARSLADHDNKQAVAAAAKQNTEETRELIKQARQLQKEMKYDDALVLLDRAIFIEPENFTAQLLSEVIEDSKVAVDHKSLSRERRLDRAQAHLFNREAVIPYTELLTFPEDWPELSDRRLRSLDHDSRSEADRETTLRLKKTVPVHFDANSLDSVVTYLQETTGATLAVDWQRLADEGGIERDQPISLQLGRVPAEQALELVLQQAASGGFGDPVGYTIINGVVVVSSGPKVAQVVEQEPAFITESYDRVEDNPFLAAFDNPLSTFSIDVDTASYANVRRFLQSGTLPPPDAVRIEELVNYFDYGYAPPAVIPNFEQRPTFHLDDALELPEQPPFAAHVEVTAAPWSPGNRLVRIGLKGKEIATDDRPAANLVFLLDVSGSMNSRNKLPLVKTGMTKLVQALRMDDRVAIVVYAGASGLVLDSTSDHDAVLAAIDDLSPGGSTNGAAGIQLAYDIATQNHIDGGLNRVILCTDGDFNVGITDRGALTRLIEAKANTPDTPTYLTVLGFGTGNLKDATMEELTNVGDGNYGYIDTPAEAEKLLAEQVNATLLTIAKDVKIQVEFNPAHVASYRLIGYENRLLAKEDFNNDVVDAGDIGAGHTVTALYEVVPASDAPTTVQPPRNGTTPGVDPLKYQQPAQLAEAADSGELLTLKLRYKAPDAAKVQGTSKLIEFPVKDTGQSFDEASEDAQFAAAVAGFGMLLRGSPYAGDLTWETLDRWATQHRIQWEDRLGNLTAEQQRRLEFAQLITQAHSLSAPVH